MSKKKKHGNFNNNDGIISKRHVQKPTVGKAKAVRSEALSKNGNRYVIIDDKSGEILDDIRELRTMPNLKRAVLKLTAFAVFLIFMILFIIIVIIRLTYSCLCNSQI